MPSRRKITAFDAASLAVLESLCDSTWAIFEATHPFRDTDHDDDLRDHLRLKVFILAESFGLDDLDTLQKTVLEALSRSNDQ
jgi:hypothetical protein